PYAAQISANAAQAARMAGVPILALRRPGWEPVEGDRWTLVGTVGDAAQALGPAPRRVFLALGRQEVAAFEAAPQHHYLIRSVDPVEPKLAVPDAEYLLARGPFRDAEERALLERHRIDVVVSKNSGGEATFGKIASARALGIEVVMIRRPDLPDVPSAETVEALAAIVDRFGVDHFVRPVDERGV
ncbi:precorrin-6A/cobalt-precorrin-6A reductase, partial [Mesorhizobium sp. M7A.F.Ca.CA.001.05.1.1]